MPRTTIFYQKHTVKETKVLNKFFPCHAPLHLTSQSWGNE